MRHGYRFGIILVVLLLVGGWRLSTVTAQAPDGWHHVARVIDGDTVELDGGVRVRLYGVAAPELDQRCGPEARDVLARMLNDRERVHNIMEAVCGARMHPNWFRIGGLAHDLPEGWDSLVRQFLDYFPKRLDEYDKLVMKNPIFRARTIGIGAYSTDEAMAWGVTGPGLRATGYQWDLRKQRPYSGYDRFEFDVCTRPNGDLYDNYAIRLDEIWQSLRILKQALDQIPAGPINSQKPQYQVRVPAGEAYGRIESPKGELGFYVVSNGKPNPWRYHVRAPSFVNITALEQMCLGTKIADFVLLFGVIDVVMGELDR